MGIKAWSDEEEIKLVELYSSETQDVYKLAKIFNKNHRSVISKLVNLEIYNKPNAKKSDGKTFKVLLRELEILLDIEIDGVNLNKKSNLEILVDALKAKLEQSGLDNKDVKIVNLD